MPDWWIGRKHSEETKEKMRLARQGTGNSFFGKKHSSITKEKISKNRIGKCCGKKNHTFGKPRDELTRAKISETRKLRGCARDEKNPMWRGGISSIVRKSKRESGVQVKIQQWRERVLEKANFSCERCGKTNNLHVHHRKNWHDFPSLRFRLSNGECLCHSCHSIETVKEVKKWQKKVG